MADASTSNAFVPISETDRAALRRDGFLLVRGALDEPLRARLETAVDELYARAAEAGEVHPDGSARVPCVLRHEDFAELLDLPAVFPHVWGHLGWNIVVDHAHVDAGPPLRGAPPFAGMPRRGRRDADGPMLAMEVGYVLSGPPAKGRDAGPGDAFVADRRLWNDHAPISGKTAFLGYTYRWNRDRDTPPAEAYGERLSPVRRQLLGHGDAGSLGVTAAYDGIPLRAELKGRGLLGGGPH